MFLYCYLLELARLDWEVCFVASGGDITTKPAFDVRFGEPGSSGMFLHAFWNIPIPIYLIGVVMGALSGTNVIAISNNSLLWWIQLLGLAALIGIWCLEALPPMDAHACDWDGVYDELGVIPSLIFVYAGALAILSVPIGFVAKWRK